MRGYISNGVRLGVLIAPYDRTVEISRPQKDPELLHAPETVHSIPNWQGSSWTWPLSLSENHFLPVSLRLIHSDVCALQFDDFADADRAPSPGTPRPG